MEHPHLFLTRRKTDGLRTIDEVRDATTRGLSGMLWQRLRATADMEMQADPLLPTSDLPHRGQESIAHANRDYQICKATGDRLLTAALVGLLTGDTAYRDAALRQIEALFDETRWPDWRDLAHLHHPADLRTGMLGKDIALAYDWLHPLLTEA